MKTLRGRGASLEELEEVYRREFGRFLRTAAAIAGDVEAGRDAVQEAFASAVRNRRRFRGEAPLEAWLWRAVVTRAHNERRRAGRPYVPEGLEAAGEESVLDRDEALRAAVSALPERERHVLFLRYFADLDYKAIGRVLGIKVGTVSATLNHAHAALRSDLQEVAP
jgi:RNA polymerase sigma factor (sigma-70 family)